MKNMRRLTYNKKYMGLGACLAVILLAAVSCAKEVALPMQIINPDRESIVAPAFGADYEITVVSNTSWELEAIGEDWIVSSFEGVVGNSSFTLTVSANAGEERGAEVIIRSADGNLTRTVKITQLSGNGDGPIPIAAVRAMEKKGGSLQIPTGEIAGFVSINRANGNYPENTVYIQDSFTEKSSGIAVFFENMPEFDFGVQMSVDLTGATLERSDDGVLTICPVETPLTGECSALEIIPPVLEYEELASGDWESMLVKLNKFQPTSEYVDKEFGASPVVENKLSQKIQLTVKPDALFSEATYLKGSGTVCGIAVAATGGRPSIRPQSAEAVKFGKYRIGELPGIKSLPYAFSFYCTTVNPNTDAADTKYITYTPLTWMAATRMISGIVATEKDDAIGAYLEMAAYASELGKTPGGKGKTNCWSEAGGNDNINTAGFVSPDSKTKPTSECGWWLTVPLQTDLPSKFNVLFGLAGADWSINRWKLSYSHDKQNWVEAGDVTIGAACSGGSYYYRFCVPVTTDSPFEADSNLYLKLTPCGTDACNPNNLNADGHGSSCYVRFHSAIVIQDATAGSTAVPEGAVLFEPFDNLTQGADWFYGERNAALANLCGSAISAWKSDQTRGMTGTEVYERPGYAQIGFVNDETTGARSKYVGSKGSLTTAPLGRAGDFTLSFKAAAYRTPAVRPGENSYVPDVASPDITEAVVRISGGGTINGSSSVKVSGLPTDYSWRNYSFSIKGATAATTLTFTSEPAEGKFSRWFIDEILVK